MGSMHGVPHVVACGMHQYRSLLYIPQLWIGWRRCVSLIPRVNIHSWLHVWWMQTYAVSLWGNTSIEIVLLMQSIRFVYKFNMRGAFYPHSGVRSPPAWTNYFYVFSCYCWFCVLYLSVTDGVCTGQCFLTEICSDTQLMQKYRDISLRGGFLPHATLSTVIVPWLMFIQTREPLAACLLNDYVL